MHNRAPLQKTAWREQPEPHPVPDYADLRAADNIPTRNNSLHVGIKRVKADHGARGAGADRLRERGTQAHRHRLDRLGGFLTHLVEERVQRLGVFPSLAPHDLSGVVVRHQRQRVMMFLPRDLIDPDLHQAGEPFGIQLIGGHPLRDRPHRAPGDPHQLTTRLLIRLRDQPRHHLLKIPGEPRAWPRERHPLDHHPVLWAPQSPPPHTHLAHPTPPIQMPPRGVRFPRVVAMPAPELTVRAGQQPPDQTKPDPNLTTTRAHLPRSGIHPHCPWQVQQLVQ